MALKVITGPTAEPLTVAEVMAHLRLDAGNQEPAPEAPTVALTAPAAAGNVDNGAHRYLVTFVTANGETQAGTPSAAVTVTDKTVNGKVSLTAIPVGGSAVTARKIYRTAAGGTLYLLLAAIANNMATTYTDNIADSALGAGAPSTNTTDDPLLSMLIASAREAAEARMRRKLVTQTLELYLDAFPCQRTGVNGDAILLQPVQSVTAITYVDDDGETQTLAPSDYLVDDKSSPSRITPAYGLSWPVTRQQHNAVTVQFIAGYGDASAVPGKIKDWMKLRIATLWINRAEMVIDGRGMVAMPESYVDGMLDSERVWGLP
jgi:uncharacterized phiE125 gp8 family phage protein